ncbi:MAG: double zinc ribbon domain-containing protein, partial [Patescibacteria group bacterium]|nr:double zinc ribbon domain-containing protein [Patescibacteria group bacterium]
MIKNYKLKIKNCFDFLLDLLFPKYCVGCGQEGVWICQKCQKKIVLVSSPTCPVCKKLTKAGKFCADCRKKSFLSGLIVAAYYQEGPLKEAIHI